MSDSLKEAIRKSRESKDPAFMAVLETVRTAWNQILPDLLNDARVKKLFEKIALEKLKEIAPQEKKDGMDADEERIFQKILRNIPPARPGADGKSIVGPKGSKGPKGDSVKGDPGKKGNDGSPDTPDQVVKKVNKANIKVKMSSISGLEDTLTSLAKSISSKRTRDHGGGGGGGGGMGKVLHERFPVTSVSTSVTTSAKIAGGGFALWAFYNGQNIMRGTHYTVGGNIKTLTFLFTPDDGENYVDIIYVRA